MRSRGHLMVSTAWGAYFCVLCTPGRAVRRFMSRGELDFSHRPKHLVNLFEDLAQKIFSQINLEGDESAFCSGEAVSKSSYNMTSRPAL